MKNENHPARPDTKNAEKMNEIRMNTMRRVLEDRPLLDSLREEDRELLINLYTERLADNDPNDLVLSLPRVLTPAEDR